MVDGVRHFFELNRAVVYLAYGLVFFVLGLSIALQSRRHSRLLLARRLRWLIAFGLLHALHEWGDLLIPIQRTYLSIGAVRALLVAQTALLGLSFACLMQFGIDLFRPLPARWKWLRHIPTALLVTWGGLTIAALLWSGHPTEAVLVHANIAARYVLCLPGALIAALGLWRRAPHLVAPLHDAHSLRLLRVAGLALAGYALTAGVIVPAGPWFPANVVNAEAFASVVGVPIYVFRSLLGLVLVVAVIRMLELFQMEMDARLSALEESRIVSAERERIARDLHDRTLQSVYAAGLTLNACIARQKAADCAPCGDELASSVAILDQAVDELRQHIADLHAVPEHADLAESLSDLVHRSAIASMAVLDLAIDIPPDAAFRPRAVGHVLGIVSESLSNIARHAAARHVAVTVAVRDGTLEVTVVDDGHGIPTDYVAGFGISDMHQRARLLGARLDILSHPAKGTRVNLTVPLAEMYR